MRVSSDNTTSTFYPDSASSERSTRYIRDAECRTLTGLSRSTRWRLEREGKFPRRRQHAARAIGWVEAELEEWMRQREVAAARRLRCRAKGSTSRAGGEE